MIAPAYRAQVDLLLRLLPYVAEETVFALKGGTAINLFVRNMPRLSVDIDLTYLPLDPRPTALQQIAQVLARIKTRAERAMAGIRINLPAQADGQEVKLLCRLGQAQVKIEVNITLRGQVQPTRLLQVTEVVQEEFGKFAPCKSCRTLNFLAARSALRLIKQLIFLWTGGTHRISRFLVVWF